LKPVCLTVGGSDSCSGAGIQADLRVFEHLGVKGCSAITALTAQNPDQIISIHPSPIGHFLSELESIHQYYEITCIKTGMLLDDKHIQKLSDFLHHIHYSAGLVIDSVFVSTSGKSLLEKNAISILLETLTPFASLITPNHDEAQVILGKPIEDPLEAASEMMLKLKTPVLLKGGDRDGETIQDLFCDTSGDVMVFKHARKNLHKDSAHGTGCRLASAISAYIALGEPLEQAVHNAEAWLQTAL